MQLPDVMQTDVPPLQFQTLSLKRSVWMTNFLKNKMLACVIRAWQSTDNGNRNESDTTSSSSINSKVSGSGN